MRIRSTAPLVLVVLTLSAACVSSGQPSASVAPDASPTAGASAVGGGPPGCEPIDLRSPRGERIELDGTWVDESGGAPLIWRIRTHGRCVWGAGQPPGLPIDEALFMAQVQTLRGTIESDFTIYGEMVQLGPEDEQSAVVQTPIWADVQFEIDFDDEGRVTLREDRVHGVLGPRCAEPTFICLRPLVLVRAD